MSKQKQAKKNFELSGKLADYLVDNPKILGKYPNSSYVLFSKNDEELNKVNTTLIPELIKEGKIIIKAEETHKKQEPWIFTPINC